MLDKLAEEDSNQAKEEKYISPKTRKNLSPAVRKMVEENNITEILVSYELKTCEEF